MRVTFVQNLVSSSNTRARKSAVLPEFHNPRIGMASMTKKRDIHVVPHGDRWATKKEGAARAGSITDTQGEAISAARSQAIRERVEVVIHRADGTIRDSDSYGNDPNPPRDRKH